MGRPFLFLQKLISMKKYVNLFFTLIVTATLSIAQERLELADEVGKIHLKKFDWMINLDTTRLSDLLDDQVCYIHSNGWKETKKEILDNIITGKLKYHQVEVIEYEVRSFGHAYIVTGKAQFNVSLEDKPIDIALYYSEIYIANDNGKLKLVSRHACRV